MLDQHLLVLGIGPDRGPNHSGRDGPRLSLTLYTLNGFIYLKIIGPVGPVRFPTLAFMIVQPRNILNFFFHLPGDRTHALGMQAERSTN